MTTKMCSTNISANMEIMSSENDESSNCSGIFDEQEWLENDLHLAAELGKTLLERNKDLEDSLKQQQLVIEDQAQVIEYLSKQTAALREVNDSRLKVYEQLEINNQEVEKANRRLKNENENERKKSKNLSKTLENAERRCEDLELTISELKTSAGKQSLKKKRERRRTTGFSSEIFDNGSPIKEFGGDAFFNLDRKHNELGAADSAESENLRLQEIVKEVNLQRSRERQKREELELEIACLYQENETLKSELFSFNQQETSMKALESELQMMQEFSTLKVCNRCRQRMTGEKLSDILDGNIEEEEYSTSSTVSPSSEYKYAKLQNGGQVYGSRESLMSLGARVVELGTDNSRDREDTSLLDELDAQYRLLIEKYEALIDPRRSAERGSATAVASAADDSEDCELPEEVVERTGACSSHSLASDLSKAEEASLSSGFSSDGDVTGVVVHKLVQTDPVLFSDNPLNKILSHSRVTGGSMEKHFQHTPEYKRLFQEIFAVIKQPALSTKDAAVSTDISGKKFNDDEAVSSNNNYSTHKKQRYPRGPRVFHSKQYRSSITPERDPFRAISTTANATVAAALPRSLPHAPATTAAAPHVDFSTSNSRVAQLRKTYAEVVSGSSDSRRNALMRARPVRQK